MALASVGVLFLRDFRMDIPATVIVIHRGVLCCSLLDRAFHLIV